MFLFNYEDSYVNNQNDVITIIICKKYGLFNYKDSYVNNWNGVITIIIRKKMFLFNYKDSQTTRMTLLQ